MRHFDWLKFRLIIIYAFLLLLCCHGCFFVAHKYSRESDRNPGFEPPWTHIFVGARRRPSGNAVYINTSCTHSGDSVNNIRSWAYSTVDKYKFTSLMLTNVVQKDQLMNASTTVEKGWCWTALAHATQYIEQRPMVFLILTFALVSK